MSDFTGLATVYDVECQDGRVISRGSFDHQDGEQVPLVWRHGHGDIRNVLGHAVLSVNNEPPGMRVHAKFNKSKQGLQAKQLVDSKDVTNLSIWANELIEHAVQENGKDLSRVKNGRIREVSLVLAGANSGAKIDDVIRHGDDPLDPEGFTYDGVIIHTDYQIDFDDDEEFYDDEDLEDTVVDDSTEDTEDTIEEDDISTEEEDWPEIQIEHAASTEDETIEDILMSLTEDQRTAVDTIVHSMVTGTVPVAPKGSGGDSDGPTVEEVFNTLSNKQKTVVYYLAGRLAGDSSMAQGDQLMTTQNIFEEGAADDSVLAHEAVIMNMVDAAKERHSSSLRQVFAQNDIVIEHSITDVDNMFPEAQAVQPGGPLFLSRPMEWVEMVLTGASTRPFSRIKSWYADITADAARAKGYITGEEKVEEIFPILKRVTLPQTIYKIQSLDRDDTVDITDFDVVVWLKGELRTMLREELARAILVSDGRANTGNDAIQTGNIRPIYNDDPLYTIPAVHNLVGDEKAFSTFTDAEILEFIDFVTESMKDYRGSGSPTMYIQQAALRKMLTIRDSDLHRLYRSADELASELGVSKIVEVPVMDGVTQTGLVDPTGLPSGTYTVETIGVIANLKDYVIGATNGGQTNFFDDFDIDFNQFKYLYETRVAGALVTPKSALHVGNVTAKTA